VAESENAILESNSILKFILPDLYISVLDPAIEDFKASALAALKRANALIVHASHNGNPHWQVPDGNTTPIFRIQPPEYVTAEIVKFVESKLRLVPARPRSS
jgi:hypothetical protein